MSKSFELGKEDYKRIARQITIIYTPVLLLFLQQLQTGNFDYKVLYALAISTTIDIVRRFLRDYTK